MKDINTHTIAPLQAPDITVRMGGASDAVALRRLAITDSALPLTGPVLVAEMDGRIVAAVALAGGRSIADPFVRSAAIVEMLELRAAQLRSAPAPARRGQVIQPVAPHAA